jgi:small subunit ribosomal protein S9
MKRGPIALPRTHFLHSRHFPQMQFARWAHTSRISLGVRAYATAFVPPQAGRDRAPRPPPILPKPESPSFFTAQANFYDTLTGLEFTKRQIRQILTRQYLLPISPKRRAILKPNDRAMWQPVDQLSGTLNHTLRTSHYRQLIGVLNEIRAFRSIAMAGRLETLAEEIDTVLSQFERPDKERLLANKAKAIQMDEYGRTYAVGRRKESHARVWVIPTKMPRIRYRTVGPVAPAAESIASPAVSEAAVDLAPENRGAQSSWKEELNDPLPSHSTPTYDSTLVALTQPVSEEEARKRAFPTFIPPVTEVLINNTPLSRYFDNPADREKVMLPFKVTGTVGKYNVFAIVRGGGTTGQAGAVALGISKGLKVHFPNGKPLLRQGWCDSLGTRLALMAFWHLSSGFIEARSSHGRAEEDGIGQSSQALHLGQALIVHSQNIATEPMYIYAHYTLTSTSSSSTTSIDNYPLTSSFFLKKVESLLIPAVSAFLRASTPRELVFAFFPLAASLPFAAPAAFFLGPGSGARSSTFEELTCSSRAVKLEKTLKSRPVALWIKDVCLLVRLQ